MVMPKQKPGKSKQDYRTPVEFLTAVKRRLHINDFFIDLAADAENAVCERFISEEMDSLVADWPETQNSWAWLNPPYDDIEPWVAKAANACANGTQVAMLVPASVGANWWRGYVEPYAYQSFLNGRLCFIPDWREQGYKSPPLYPKDCALLLFTNWGFIGHEIWRWKV